MIRNVTPSDANEVVEIYNHYIKHSTITFEESPISTEEMSTRIEDSSLKLPWLVYEENTKILGYALASEWKSRCAYKYSVESTVYLKPGETGKGIGTLLYVELVRRLKEMNLHAIIGGISLPNEASIALHEKIGFEKVGQFKQVGYKFGKWIDVGYWELITQWNPNEAIVEGSNCS